MNKLKFIGILLAGFALVLAGCDALIAGTSADLLKSRACEITSFTLSGVEGTVTPPAGSSDGAIAVTVPYGTAVTALTPVIVKSDRATITPTGAQNFTNPVTYTVTSDDGIVVKKYVATVTIGANPNPPAPALTLVIYNINDPFPAGGVTLVGAPLGTGDFDNSEPTLTKTAFDASKTLVWRFDSTLVAAGWFDPGMNFVYDMVKTGTWDAAFRAGGNSNHFLNFTGTFIAVDEATM